MVLHESAGELRRRENYKNINLSEWKLTGLISWFNIDGVNKFSLHSVSDFSRESPPRISTRSNYPSSIHLLLYNSSTDSRGTCCGHLQLIWIWSLQNYPDHLLPCLIAILWLLPSSRLHQEQEKEHYKKYSLLFRAFFPLKFFQENLFSQISLHSLVIVLLLLSLLSI